MLEEFIVALSEVINEVENVGFSDSERERLAIAFVLGDLEIGDGLLVCDLLLSLCQLSLFLSQLVLLFGMLLIRVAKTLELSGSKRDVFNQAVEVLLSILQNSCKFGVLSLKGLDVLLLSSGFAALFRRLGLFRGLSVSRGLDMFHRMDMGRLGRLGLSRGLGASRLEGLFNRYVLVKLGN